MRSRSQPTATRFASPVPSYLNSPCRMLRWTARSHWPRMPLRPTRQGGPRSTALSEPQRPGDRRQSRVRRSSARATPQAEAPGAPKIEAVSEARACYQAEHIAAREAGAAVTALTVDTETAEVRRPASWPAMARVPDDLGQLVESF